MSFKGLKMLKIPKLPDFEKYWKSSKNIQRGYPWKKKNFSFLFNTLFYTRQSYKTIRMSFGGLRMLKSPKLTQCYSFASVITGVLRLQQNRKQSFQIIRTVVLKYPKCGKTKRKQFYFRKLCSKGINGTEHNILVCNVNYCQNQTCTECKL